MLNNKIKYFKLIGSNKEKIEEIKNLMIKSYIELRDLNGFYYYQSFKEYNDVNIPMHLITGDIALIVCYGFGRRRYDLFETFIYSEGRVEKFSNDYDLMYIKSRGHITEKEFILKEINNEVKKESYDELIKYSNSKLFESILELSYETYFEGDSDIGDFRDIIHYIDELYEYFKAGQNLDFETFVSLFS